MNLFLINVFTKRGLCLQLQNDQPGRRLFNTIVFETHR